ncbi:hypothetical protein [Maricaulis sp.]|uniref:hypothetical protein n=1 Tax=Maricaulis sp. TaxID=1486257 RepID=UPI002639BD83|nr:hypothetical protein [Maricaulis sp.]
MFRQTIRFERAQDAFVFDRHIAEFLRSCGAAGDSAGADACLFTSSLQDDEAHIRVVQTDSADLLGRLLIYLTRRDFPPTTQGRAGRDR